MSEENKEKLEAQIKLLKKQLIEEKEENDFKFKRLSIEKAEFIAKINSLEASIKDLEERYTQKEEELRTKIKADRSDFERKEEIQKQEIEEWKSKIAEINNVYLSQKNDKDTKEALLSQQVEHLKKNNDELKKRENTILREREQEKENLLNKARESEESLLIEIEKFKEIVEDREDKITELEQKISEQKMEYEEMLTDYDKNMSNSNGDNVYSSEEYLELKAKFDNLEELKREEIEQIESKLAKENEDLLTQLKHNQEMSRRYSKTMQDQQTKFENEIAISDQKLEFNNIEIASLKQTIENIQKSHFDTLKLIEKKDNDLEEIKSEFTKNHNEYKEKAQKDIADLTSKYDEL